MNLRRHRREFRTWRYEIPWNRYGSESGSTRILPVEINPELQIDPKLQICIKFI